MPKLVASPNTYHTIVFIVCVLWWNSQFFHKDNIALNHILFLIHEFTQETYNKNTLATYDSCNNFPQTKYRRFMRPPIEASHLTLNIKEFNPNKDIHTSQPTIQIQRLDAHIFDHIGAHIISSHSQEFNGCGRDSHKIKHITRLASSNIPHKTLLPKYLTNSQRHHNLTKEEITNATPATTANSTHLHEIY